MAAFVSRYASAFADVVTAARLDTAAIDQKMSDFLATWQGSPELREFFENPAIATIEKVAILDKLNAKLGMQKQLRNLIAVLISNNRIAQVSEVAQAYRALLQQQLGISPAEIVTARELDAKEREALVAEIARLAGSKIDASFKLDASILGGTVVRIGSTVYDGSVRGRLDRLKEALTSGQ
ncbi:MAG TPA: ATP synthase F1 subunit delta [Terracidiphilus sp.]|jgi:F-type H+-transporting ATPase subunit delta|nr:ATP synthase F1 subunit delta [Terracidiphilus sp.]